ncbi:MAG: substrate-binding domain-containing protein [Rubrivivax sp.]
MASPLRLISSMATRQVLAELTAAHERAGGSPTNLEAVGGVDAARRVQEGEVFDLVVLAASALSALESAGKTVAGSTVALVRSGVSVAVPAGAPQPDIGTEDALKAAVLDAPTLGYSTGPSGTHLLKTFERWGILETVRPRIVQAPPGVPVARLVAQGEVALGFQQLSELLHVPGSTIVGPLPPGVQTMTTFSAALAATCSRQDEARALLAYMASPAAAAAKVHQGMEPA